MTSELLNTLLIHSIRIFVYYTGTNNKLIFFSSIFDLLNVLFYDVISFWLNGKTFKLLRKVLKYNTDIVPWCGGTHAVSHSLDVASHCLSGKKNIMQWEHHAMCNYIIALIRRLECILSYDNIIMILWIIHWKLCRK